MNPSILTTEVQNFIINNLDSDLNRILLGKSPFKDVSARELVEQIESKKLCDKKLPLWYNTPNIYYPPKLAIEQASSEITAKYKTQLLKGNAIIDITGGFGVDDYHFALSTQQVVHCEMNIELSAIVQYNAKILQAERLFCHAGNGLHYLQNSNRLFDTIYIDPSRRVNANKVFKLTESEPNIITNLPLLTQQADRLILKTSPLLDIKSGLTVLKNVREIHILSVKNDCKELLWVIDHDFAGDNEPQIYCAAINKYNYTETYQFKLSEEKALSNIPFSMPLTFIYEPDVALLKAGCFKLLTKQFDVLKLHQHTHLYTSDLLKPHFIGKKFRLKNSWKYKTFCVQKPLKQANIISRNFPLSTKELQKKHRIKEGGEVYLLFTTDHQNQLIVLNCERL